MWVGYFVSKNELGTRSQNMSSVLRLKKWVWVLHLIIWVGYSVSTYGLGTPLHKPHIDSCMVSKDEIWTKCEIIIWQRIHFDIFGLKYLELFVYCQREWEILQFIHCKTTVKYWGKCWPIFQLYVLQDFELIDTSIWKYWIKARGARNIKIHPLLKNYEILREMPADFQFSCSSGFWTRWHQYLELLTVCGPVVPV